MELSKMCDTCQQMSAVQTERTPAADDTRCMHKRPSKWRQMCQQKAYRPFMLTMLAFATCQLNGMVPIRPNLVQVFRTYGLPLNENWATVSKPGLLDQLVG